MVKESTKTGLKVLGFSEINLQRNSFIIKNITFQCKISFQTIPFLATLFGPDVLFDKSSKYKIITNLFKKSQF